MIIVAIPLNQGLAPVMAEDGYELLSLMIIVAMVIMLVMPLLIIIVAMVARWVVMLTCIIHHQTLFDEL